MKRKWKHSHKANNTHKHIFSRYARNVSGIFRSRDFTDIENSAKAGEVIQQLASMAVTGAISEAKARGITRVYAIDGEIVSENSNGDKTVIGRAETNDNEFFVKYQPGTIMHASKH
jgi:hypothetical protein